MEATKNVAQALELIKQYLNQPKISPYFSGEDPKLLAAVDLLEKALEVLVKM